MPKTSPRAEKKMISHHVSQNASWQPSQHDYVRAVSLFLIESDLIVKTAALSVIEKRVSRHVSQSAFLYVTAARMTIDLFLLSKMILQI
mmetsp:Transcript_34122/g.72695  ORF Transcript_34122/g.72695 Transcript_34122/m.72695 type:complete len:89 (-) Transcript_34122:966-1232(-)